MLPSANPWTKIVPTNVLETLGNVTLVVPATVALVLRIAIAGLLLVMVTVTGGLGGVAVKETLKEVCKSFPTNTFCKLMVAAATVAVICRKFAGVLKPAGVPTAIVAVPTVSGLNAVDPKEAPPLKITGLVTIVPTLVFELVTGTFTGVKPPRTC